MMLISNIHDASSAMAAGDGIVVAGGNDLTDNHLYAFTVAELETAIEEGTTLDAVVDGDEVYTGAVAFSGGAVAIMGGSLYVAIPGEWPAAVTSIVAVPLTVADGGVSAGSETTIVTLEAEAVIDTVDLSASGSLLGIHYAVTDGETQTHHYLAIAEQ